MTMGGEESGNELCAESSNECRHSKIHKPYSQKSEECALQTIDFCGAHDGSNKGKATTEEDRNFAFRDKMKNECANTCREQSS